MKHSTYLLIALLAALLMGNSACTGTITEGSFGGDVDLSDPGATAPPTPEQEEEARLCVGDGDAGGSCEVTADCNAPMVCLNNSCVGPKDPSYACDEVEGIGCLQAGESCINGLCVATPGACETLDDCPNGFVCAAGQCTPERDGSACSDPGPGPALAGTYQVDSVLFLRDALPGVVAKILDVSETARDIINGQIDLGLPSIVNFIVGGLVSGIIRQFVPAYGIDIVNALASMSDVLNTMGVEGTLELDGVACDGNYRGRHNWDFVKVTLNGIEQRIRPSDLPGVDNVVPEDFSARYHCGDLLIDKHRIQNSMGTLVRWVLDTSVQAATGLPTVEAALSSLVDCQAVGQTLSSAAGINVTGLAAGACQAAISIGVAKVTQAIDDAAVKMSLLKLQAVVPVNSDGSFAAGTWYGSLVGGDFKGSLDASR